MLTDKRHALIIDVLGQHNFLSLQQLMDYTGSSASTIRRDLTKLQSEGLLTRVHGGAKLIDSGVEPELSMKRTQHIEEKIEIAKQAASLINDNDCVYLDAGSTTLEMIPFISATDITVVTNGLTHVESLLKQGIRIYIVGGEMKSTTMAVVGTRAVNFLRNYCFNKVFLGINGIDVATGLTTPDEREALMKEVAIQQSQQTYVLADASKFYQTHFATVKAVEPPIVITSAFGRQRGKEILKTTNIELLGG
ncbi:MULTISPECIES: DeoR/GlpR family DNA-binding transcription regulator [unclassified Staphylococcus]|uniref:DeoR/GlpR family DNA-binding transcription regulator n=1 Tax=unclassified Staphylococcus TaxID=91994 RepID=UPI0021CE91F8|nr:MULTISPECIES: DeoR/GlpR family DNA-binding transcription regulator [unclassified Staphylococcus]UXR78710.1 DeoR/GlpR family DNA-binding transcription regulator [Staphylococcus sp. IVB6227]UXR82869.1 DeoR/GlpR family DNA-binding transcription regulator [Staphylococcus sp. IVB6214]